MWAIYLFKKKSQIRPVNFQKNISILPIREPGQN